MEILFKLLSFIVAIGVLVTIHEFGHFWVARRCGVKVLRFSIGFGRPLWQRIGPETGIEYVIAAIPLGGYVKMLDEREAPVDPAERHLAFNTQSLKARSAIVAAGPIANFIFALVAFWGVLIIGETGIRPGIGEIKSDSIAEQAGFKPGDLILSVNETTTPSWYRALYELAGGSVGDDPIAVRVREASGLELVKTLPPGAIGDLAEKPSLLKTLGMSIDLPDLEPVIGDILENSAAKRDGLQSGDRILLADGGAINTWTEWVEYVQARPNQAMSLLIERNGAQNSLTLTPDEKIEAGQVIGFIGAGVMPLAEEIKQKYRVEVRYGPFEAIPLAAERTWDLSGMMLKVLGRIITGEASVKNLSGPITIADVAGKSASLGFVPFLELLALISVSLGVMNLLPVPVLDGGHLLFFAIEGLRGQPPSEQMILHGQQIGLAILLGVMALAFYVDLSRYLG